MSPARPVLSDLSAATGARVRALRTARGMTMDALAARSGLGKGTLSELEAGRRNPTLETLYAVTTALGAPLTAVLPSGEVVADRPAPHVEGEAIDAVLVDRFVDGATTTELYRIAIRAGSKQTSAPHGAGVTEHWILYAGSLQLGPSDAQVELVAGQSATFAADREHRYCAGADEDVAATLLVRYP